MLRLHRAGLPWSLGLRARGWRAMALSAREAAKREGDVRDALRGVVDRDLNRDVVTLGMTKNMRIDADGERVSCQIESLPGRDACRILQSDAEAALRALPWVRDADVEVVAPHPQPLKPSLMPGGLASVANVVAVASGKGGVGKSTVAVHLARALRQRGARVGLFDADLYGPSIPTLLGTTRVAAEPAYSADEAASSGDPAAAQMVKPVLAWGDVPTMSIGYSAQQQQREGEAAVMRGPMASNVLRQLLSFTQWGPLDFLVVDLPPGTGDIQLTLTQNVAVAAAVVVTTPNRLARPDVVKGINMFGRVRVPTAALVENMSYFVSPDGSRQMPFGSSHAGELQREFLVPHLCTLPLDPTLADEDLSSLNPTVAGGDIAREFDSLANAVASEVARQRAKGGTEPRLTYNPQANEFILRLFTADAAWESRISARDLRLRCRCAACVDEVTGTPLLREDSVPSDVEAVRVAKRGNYGVAVTWSDGHDSSIYSFDQVEAILREGAE